MPRPKGGKTTRKAAAISKVKRAISGGATRAAAQPLGFGKGARGRGGPSRPSAPGATRADDGTVVKAVLPDTAMRQPASKAKPKKRKPFPSSTYRARVAQKSNNKR
jgi:mevalonate pyrophosphate decarboxylase